MTLYSKIQFYPQQRTFLTKVIISVVLLSLISLCVKLICDSHQEKRIQIGSYYPPDITGWNREVEDNRTFGREFGIEVWYAIQGNPQPLHIDITFFPKDQTVRSQTPEYMAREYVDVIHSFILLHNNIMRSIKNNLKPVNILNCSGYVTSTTYIVREKKVNSSKNMYISGKDGVYEFKFRFRYRYGNKTEESERKKVMGVAWRSVTKNLKDMCGD